MFTIAAKGLKQQSIGVNGPRPYALANGQMGAMTLEMRDETAWTQQRQRGGPNDPTTGRVTSCVPPRWRESVPAR